MQQIFVILLLIDNAGKISKGKSNQSISETEDRRKLKFGSL